MSPAEPTANPGQPGHEGIASPPSGSTEPAAGWRPREPPLIVVDPAFVLDRWRPGDGAALRRFDLDPGTARFYGYAVEQAQAMPDSHYDGDERARGSLRAWHEGRDLNLAIRRRPDGEAAGWVELRLAGNEAEVSYNVTAELRGQGIASRALQAFLTWAAQQIGLRRAHLACHIDNLASRRVAEKCGFVLLGQQASEGTPDDWAARSAASATRITDLSSADMTDPVPTSRAIAALAWDHWRTARARSGDTERPATRSVTRPSHLNTPCHLLTSPSARQEIDLGQ